MNLVGALSLDIDMIVDCVETGWLKLIGDDFGRVGNDVFVDSVLLIGLGKVHVTHTLNSQEVKLPLVVGSLKGCRSEEKFQDDHERDH